jgi:hypothetical protein
VLPVWTVDWYEDLMEFVLTFDGVARGRERAVKSTGSEGHSILSFVCCGRFTRGLKQIDTYSIRVQWVRSCVGWAPLI